MAAPVRAAGPALVTPEGGSRGAAGIPSPGLDPFPSCYQRDRQRGKRIGPPPAEHGVRRQPDEQDRGQVGAQQRLLGVGHRRRRAQLATGRAAASTTGPASPPATPPPARCRPSTASARSPPARARTDSTLTYAASAKNENAMTRSAARSRRSGSRPENCQATAAAEETSINESSPKPTNAVDDGQRAGGQRHRPPRRGCTPSWPPPVAAPGRSTSARASRRRAEPQDR